MLINNERTYGIEIEFICKNVQGLTRRIRNKGIDVRCENYNHETRTWWKIVTDSSVKPNMAQRNRGVRTAREIVSPILKGAEGLRQLKIVCEALQESDGAEGLRQLKSVCEDLQESDCEVNRTCGLHIHHGTQDFGIQNFRDLAKIYARFENTLDSLMPNSRRGNNNQYCQSNSSYFGDIYDLERANRAIEGCNSVREIVNFFRGSRFLKLNFRSFVTHSTIEFRHHSGTLEFTKIANWVCLTQAMVERTFRGKIVSRKDGQVDNWQRFTTMLKFKSTSNVLDDVIKYYKKRQRKLAV